jgi:hypothetical protein
MILKYMLNQVADLDRVFHALADPGRRVMLERLSKGPYADDTRISVSVATIEFAETGDGSALTWTEQGAYLDGIDGPGAPQMRSEGVAEMLDGLEKYLTSQPVS